MKKALCILLAVALAIGCALGAQAEMVSLDGTVVCLKAETVLSAFGGTVESVAVSAGDHVNAGDTLASLSTTKVYAEQDGTVRTFGETGDSVQTVASRYGAVAYIEPDVQYTISASTENAFDSEENRIVHPGESVYLRGYTNTEHTGTGIVTTVNGTSFTVEVLSGTFESDETVSVYRSGKYSASSRIGRGDIAHQAPVAYSGSGILAAFCVEIGAQVKKGDLLYETLEGNYSGNVENPKALVSSISGVVSEIMLSAGGNVQTNGSVACIYLDEGMRINATVAESELMNIVVGDTVRIELPYPDVNPITITGTVERISMTAQENMDSSETKYSVYIVPESTDKLLYGMNVVVYIGEEEAAETEDVEEAAEDAAEETTGETEDAETSSTKPADMPEGFDPSNMPEGFDPANKPDGTPPAAPDGTPPAAPEATAAADETVAEEAAAETSGN